METHTKRKRHIKSRILGVVLAALAVTGTVFYIRSMGNVSNLQRVIDTVSHFCALRLGERTDERTSIIAVLERAPVWIFRVSATESTLGYGTFDSRTLKVTFTQSSEGITPGVFQPGYGGRLSSLTASSGPLTQEERLERAVSLRQFLSGKETAEDIEFWPISTPDSISLWHAVLNHGWIDSDDKCIVIFLYDRDAFDGQLDFHAEPSYDEDNSPAPSAISIWGSIRARTLRVHSGPSD